MLPVPLVYLRVDCSECLDLHHDKIPRNSFAVSRMSGRRGSIDKAVAKYDKRRLHVIFDLTRSG